MELDEKFMHRCLTLAEKSMGYAAPNPKVGAVLVYQGRIIGEGWHQNYGEAHAEVNALASVRAEDHPWISSSTLYINLEPCHHFGQTPPCVDLILKHKIPRVVVAMQDPFTKVAGKSLEKLKRKGVELRIGILAKEARWMNRRFLTMVEQKRPYVLLKYAQTKDGYLGQKNKQLSISNDLSKRMTHKWRAEEMAILVGTTTALVDNPQLNNRYYGGRSPLRLVLDRSLRLPKTLHLFDQTQETWVFTEQVRNLPASLPQLKYISIPFDANWIESILNVLHQRKIQSLLVEGGAQLLHSFIGAEIWDEARIWTSNICLGEGIKAPSIPQKYHKNQRILGNNYLDTYWKFK